LLTALGPERVQGAGVDFVARPQAYHATLEYAGSIDSLHNLQQSDLLGSFG
jgi:hypothetical protein